MLAFLNAKLNLILKNMVHFAQKLIQYAAPRNRYNELRVCLNIYMHGNAQKYNVIKNVITIYVVEQKT